MTPLFLALLLEARAAEARWELPPLLLVAVCLHESRGRNIVTGERDGHCSAGPAQVLVRGCDRERLRRMLVLSVNLDEAGRLLARSRDVCSRRPRWAACKRSPFALYNSGSSRWWRGVSRIWDRLRWQFGGDV